MQRFLMVIILSALALVLTACGGDNSPTTPTANPSASDNTQTGTNRPSAPANDDFRSDPASWVANSGFPQLVEVFSYD
ncbi:MAG: hypothetical protein KJ043_18785 [Anaerolineae bacterium]|nr:hypothetical protein [Anaerolineae bacterium]